MPETISYNQERPGVWSKMRKYFGVMVWVSIGYLAGSFMLKSLIWYKVLELIEDGKLNDATALIIANSNRGVDFMVLTTLLGIAFSGKVVQKFAESK